MESKSSGGGRVQCRFSSAEEGGGGKEEKREQRSRILTMKYGKQQMMLIRKRLKVEMWLMESLEELYDDEVCTELLTHPCRLGNRQRNLFIVRGES